MGQPRVDNRTEFAVHPQLLLDLDGEKLAVIVKASFEARRGKRELDLAPPHRTRGVRMADIPWGDPEKSSIAYPADLFLRKPGTDVIVVAKGYAPKETTSFDVRVVVGPVQKTLRLHGPRVWLDDGTVGAAGPLKELELRYEHAYGGFDDSDADKPVEEPRNPVGSGLVAPGSSLAGSAAPQIEDPKAPIGGIGVVPKPVGIGVVGRSWEPRRRYAGTHDDSWREQLAPLPPRDFDDRFNVCAAEGMWSATPLSGGETIELSNLLPDESAKTLELPRVALEIAFRRPGEEPHTQRPHLDTVIVDLLETGPDKPPAVEMVWRASIPAPRRVADCTVVVREVRA